MLIIYLLGLLFTVGGFWYLVGSGGLPPVGENEMGLAIICSVMVSLVWPLSIAGYVGYGLSKCGA